MTEYYQDLNKEKMLSLYRFVCFSGISVYLMYGIVLGVAGKIALAFLCLVFSINCSIYLFFKNIPFKVLIPHVHLQIIAITIIYTLNMGWDYGVQHMLFAAIALSFITPFQKKIFPFFFALIEFFLYSFLYLYYGRLPPNPVYPRLFIDFFFLFNTFLSFLMVIIIEIKVDWTGNILFNQLVYERKKFKDLADIDSLTGLLTRRPMVAMIQNAWERYEKTNQPFFLIMADFDLFKSINDIYGHEGGDYLLRELGALLRQNLREIDYVARWGGDEFLFLITDVKSAQDAANMMERIRSAVECAEFEYEGKFIHGHMTFGCASSKDLNSLENMISLADEALYQGKNAGGNCVIIAPQGSCAINGDFMKARSYEKEQ